MGFFLAHLLMMMVVIITYHFRTHIYDTCMTIIQNTYLDIC